MTDPTPRSRNDATVLLAHADFLRGLARSLVFDVDEADDLEQETWRAALQSDPHELRSPRAWLATIARNIARFTARGRVRRDERERATAVREAVPSAADIAQRESIRRDVVAAVLALPPLYRDVILLRFYDDRPQRDIARVLGVPLETMRTREKRALAKLRAALDERHGRDRGAWCALLAPFATTKPAVSTVAVAWLAAALFLAAALPIATWLLVRANDEPRARTESAQTSAPPGDTGAAPATTPTAAGATRTATRDGATLRGTLLDVDGKPARRASVVLRGASVTQDELLAVREPGQLATHLCLATATTDDAGAFTLTGIERGFHLLRATAASDDACIAYAVVFVDAAPSTIAGAIGGSVLLDDVLGSAQRIELGADDDADCSLRLARSGVVRGRVLAPDGTPIASAEVFGLVPDFGVGPEALQRASYDELLALAEPLARSTTSGVDGSFVLPGLLGDGVVIARADGCFVGGARVQVFADREARATITLQERAALAVAGRVVDEVGQPIAQARAFLMSGSAVSSLMSLVEARGQAEANGELECTTGVGGNFRFDAIPIGDDGTFRLVPHASDLTLVVAVDGFVPAAVRDLTAQRLLAGPIEVRLARAAPLAVRVVDAQDGTPIDAAEVAASIEELELFPSLGAATTDDDGQARFDVFPARGGFVSVERVGWFDATVAVQPTQDPVVVKLERARVLRVCVVDRDGDPVPNMMDVDEPSAGFFWQKKTLHCSIYSVIAFPFDPTPGMPGAPSAVTWRFPGGDMCVSAEGSDVANIGSFGPRVHEVTLPATWDLDDVHVVVAGAGGVYGIARATDPSQPITIAIDPGAIRAEMGFVGVRAVNAATGDPVREFTTRVMRRGTRLPIAQSWSYRIGVDWTLVSAPGVYDVLVEADGFAPFVVEDFDVDAGDPGAPIVARLGPAARVAGVVTGVLPGPYLPTVCAYDARGVELAAVKASQDGAFELGGLPAGVVRLRVTDPKIGSCDVEVATVAGDEVRVALTPSNPRNVGLKLTRFGAEPERQVAFDVVDARGVPLGIPSSSLTVSTWSNIRLSVPAGRWTFRAITLEHGALETTVDVPSHGAIEVVID